jgi:hypothetical protein
MPPTARYRFKEELTMLKRRRTLLKQRKPANWSHRRKILLQDVRRKILRRNNAYFLTSVDIESAA